ncbi:MAG TPA: type II 3-dehydroquinate dehydratase, partial [Saprospiraceae bacterium]|nr:type II 3-dehydroquinate dehydratase [Saprospiraceae bacterium]
MKIIIINGPNLNMLGRREPDIYGNQSFEEYFQKLTGIFPDLSLDYFQSNHEGELIDCIQRAEVEYDGIILNAAA